MKHVLTKRRVLELGQRRALAHEEEGDLVAKRLRDLGILAALEQQAKRCVEDSRIRSLEALQDLLHQRRRTEQTGLEQVLTRRTAVRALEEQREEAL